ncbi:MAG: NAD(P)-dependent alcohol dehydrogenase [Flavobacteriales bacterium]|nr:NAD(P)-dependent alcohol dehydrogenase [Flavobacteriales bacterium]
MKAYQINHYGVPKNVLILKEVEQPVPLENEVLLRICATTINDYDWVIVAGKPRLLRLMFGFGKPKKKFQIPGMELAAVIEAVGKNVTKFKLGDEVYGDTSGFRFGTFAEYICMDENSLEIKPSGMSFEEAASIPHASMLALQGLHDIGNLQEGQKILINGGGGGVGCFALQLAKLKNIEVTGVDSGEKLKRLKELGFDQMIDYKKEDFTKLKTKYDLILDCKTNRSPFAYTRVLSPKGKYVTVGGNMTRMLQLLFLKPLISLFSTKKMFIVALKPNKDLAYISDLYTKGKIKCPIDGPYELEEIPSAVQRFGEGKHFGKIVISIKPAINS